MFSLFVIRDFETNFSIGQRGAHQPFPFDILKYSMIFVEINFPSFS